MLKLTMPLSRLVTLIHIWECLSSCDTPLTVNSGTDVRIWATYGQGEPSRQSSRSKVISSTHTHTHTTVDLHGLESKAVVNGTRTPPVEASMVVIIYLQFVILLSVHRPARHRHSSAHLYRSASQQLSVTHSLTLVVIIIVQPYM